MMISQPPYLNVSTSAVNKTGGYHDFQILPLISVHTTTIIAIIFGTFMCVATGFVGMFTNSANICVYLKLGLTETTNISFFALSICDFIMSASTIVVLVFYSRLISGKRLPSGALAAEIGIAAGNVYYPCLGCSAWITAILSTDRCLCIAMPLKVNIGMYFISEFDLLGMATLKILRVRRRDAMGILLFTYISKAPDSFEE